MKEEPVRPATLEDVKLLINALNEAGAEYILIGGYALYAHDYRRATEDIDMLIPNNRHAGELTSVYSALNFPPFRRPVSTLSGLPGQIAGLLDLIFLLIFKLRENFTDYLRIDMMPEALYWQPTIGYL